MPITTLNLETASSDSLSRRALSQLSLAVAKSRRIIVVTGAGISCSSGIPVSVGLFETTIHGFWRRRHVGARLVRYICSTRRPRALTRPAHWLYTTRSLKPSGSDLDDFLCIWGLRLQASMLGPLASPIPGGGKAPSSYLRSVLVGPVFIQAR